MTFNAVRRDAIDARYNNDQWKADQRMREAQNQAYERQRAYERSQQEAAKKALVNQAARDALRSSTRSDSRRYSEDEFDRQYRENKEELNNLKTCPRQKAHIVSVVAESVAKALGKTSDQVKPLIIDSAHFSYSGEISLQSSISNICEAGEHLKCRTWNLKQFGVFKEGDLDGFFLKLHECKYIEKIIIGRNLSKSEAERYAPALKSYKSKNFWGEKQLTIEVHLVQQDEQKQKAALRYQNIAERIAIMVRRPVGIVIPHLSEEDSHLYYYTTATDCFGFQGPDVNHHFRKLCHALEPEILDLRVWNVDVYPAELHHFLNGLAALVRGRQSLLKEIIFPRDLHRFEMREFLSQCENMVNTPPGVYVDRTPVNIQEALAQINAAMGNQKYAKPPPPPAAASITPPADEEILEAR